MVYTFTLVTNIISASFNGFLTEKIETGKDPPSSGESILKDIPITFKRQVQFIFYYLPRAIFFLEPYFGINFIFYSVNVSYCSAIMVFIKFLNDDHAIYGLPNGIVITYCFEKCIINAIKNAR